MKQNGLIMHKAKIECVLFGSSNKLSKTDNFSVCVEGLVLKTVTEFKYLGVVLDGGLSYSAHIKYLLSKVGKRIGMLGPVRNQLTANSADTVFKSFILPQLDYCDTVWSCCGSTNKRLLDKLQRSASKLVLNTTDSDKAMEDLRWEPLGITQQRRENHIFSRLTKKCLQGIVPQFFMNYFKYQGDVSSHITRQSKKLSIPRVRTEYAKRSFYYQACIVFNKCE